MLQAVVIASAGLLLAASTPLARDALTDPVTIAIAVVSLIILLTTELDTLWIILASAAVSLSTSSFGLIGCVGYDLTRDGARSARKNVEPADR